MINTHQFQPPGALWPNRRVPACGSASRWTSPGPLAGNPPATVLRAVTDEIMQAIPKLTGQEYADIGARQARAAPAHGDGDSPGGDLE
jgi:hypothetical protein